MALHRAKSSEKNIELLIELLVCRTRILEPGLDKAFALKAQAADDCAALSVVSRAARGGYQSPHVMRESASVTSLVATKPSNAERVEVVSFCLVSAPIKY